MRRPGIVGGAKVAKAAKYLAVNVGVEAAPVQCTEEVAKFAQRALDVRATSQGLGARVQLCNSHFSTMPLHRGRFAQLDGLIVRCVRHAAQGLTQARLMALPRLRCFVPRRGDRTLRSMSGCALSRKRPEVKRLLDEIEVARNSDEATLSLGRPWHADIPIIRLGDVRRRCLGFGRDATPETPARTHRQLYVRFFVRRF